MDTELERNPVSKLHVQPEYGDEQADAGRDCRTRLARPNSQALTRTEKYLFFLFSADHVQDWQPYLVDPWGSLPSSAAASIYIFRPPYAIGPVPSLSGHAFAYRWRSLPRVRRHRASKCQGSHKRVLP